MPLFNEIIHTFLDASPYLLLGLFFSGLIQSFISKDKITTWIGANNFRSVLIAAIAGVPLPLCSCGVIPMAMSLRKNGASRGATTSFLISTPETGLDSILLSFALLDPLLAIIRPVAAFTTAVIAGVLENVAGTKEEVPLEGTVVKDECCAEDTDLHSHPHPPQSWFAKLKEGMYHSFVVLLGDIGLWLLFGLVLSGMISYAVPSSMIEKYLGEGMGSMLLMLVIGIPMYICASASTPIAASLLLKGAAPGAILVFLLAGPATNVTTIVMVYRFMGTRALVIYLTSIAVCALGFGILVNHLYTLWAIDIHQTIGAAAHCIDPTWQMVSGVVLGLVLSYALVKKYL